MADRPKMVSHLGFQHATQVEIEFDDYSGLSHRWAPRATTDFRWQSDYTLVQKSHSSSDPIQAQIKIITDLQGAGGDPPEVSKLQAAVDSNLYWSIRLENNVIINNVAITRMDIEVRRGRYHSKYKSGNYLVIASMDIVLNKNHPANP